MVGYVLDVGVAKMREMGNGGREDREREGEGEQRRMVVRWWFAWGVIKPLVAMLGKGGGCERSPSVVIGGGL